MATAERLYQIAQTLEPPDKVALLVEMANALQGDIPQDASPGSDLLTHEFMANFGNRLRLYHATNEERFNKKAFEYGFVAASQYAGRNAHILPNPVEAGADVEAGGTRFSLKTETGRGINPNTIRLSKLMEAVWIRSCRTPEDFASETTKRVVDHLHRYERILALRAFDVPGGPKQHGLYNDAPGPTVRYELYEVPRELLLRIGTLCPKDFSPRTGAGGSQATVLAEDGTPAFKIRLDGSVEKVTITGLRVNLCRYHGSWTVPIRVTVNEPEH